VYTYWKGCPPKFGRAKKRPKSGAISDNFRLWSRISLERIHKSKIGKVVDKLWPLPRWAKKDGEFGPQTKKLLTCILTHPSGHYSADYILAFRSCCPLKFLHALEIDSGYPAHTPTGTPPKKINCKNFDFGLKSSVWAYITSGQWEYPHQPFPGDVMNFGPQTKKL